MIEFGDLIGVPFVRGGRDPAGGLDCVGLTLEIYRRAGIELPEPSVDYVEDWANRGGLFVPNWPDCFIEIPAALEVLDVALIERDGEPHHLSVVVRPGVFIDAHVAVGVYTRRRSGVREKVLQAYRHREVAR